MKRNPDIQNELKVISTVVAGLDEGMPFTVPEGYFLNLPENILSRVKTMGNQGSEEKFSLPVTQNPVFAVPDGYFNALPEQILNRIRKMESDDIDTELSGYNPILKELRKVNPFYLREGYFEELSVNIPAKEPGKVIPMPKEKKWVRYAAAAAIAGILMLAGYFFWDNRVGEVQPLAADEREKVFENESLKISDEELSSFLEENNGIPSTELIGMAQTEQPVALLEINEQALSEMLKEISDVGIRDYMSENPEPLSPENLIN